MEEKKRKAEEMQGTAKTVLQSFGKAFSGEFLSINTGHTLGRTEDYKQLCPGSDTEMGSKTGYQAGSIWNQTLKILIKAQTQKKNVHLYCKSKSLQ